MSREKIEKHEKCVFCTETFLPHPKILDCQEEHHVLCQETTS